jgi:hypothetical protein
VESRAFQSSVQSRFLLDAFRRERSGKVQGAFREHSGVYHSSSEVSTASFSPDAFSKEHSGNIQGAFKEHSGKIRGTLREPSRNTRACTINFQSQAQPRFLLTRSENMQGTFTEHSRNIRGTFREHSGVYHSSSEVSIAFIHLTHSGSIPGTFRGRSGNTQGTFRRVP